MRSSSAGSGERPRSPMNSHGRKEGGPSPTDAVRIRDRRITQLGDALVDGRACPTSTLPPAPPVTSGTARPTRPVLPPLDRRAPSVQATPRSSADVAYDSALGRLPAPAIPVATLATLISRMDPAGAKLDQLKAATSGPYTVNGATVYAGAQFRMSGGYNADTTRRRSRTARRRRRSSGESG